MQALAQEPGPEQQHALAALADKPLSELRLTAHVVDRRVRRLPLPPTLTVRGAVLADNLFCRSVLKPACHCLLQVCEAERRRIVGN